MVAPPLTDRCRVQGVGCIVQSLGFRVYGLWFMVQGLGFMVQGLWFRVQGLWFIVQGSGSRVQGLGSQKGFSKVRALEHLLYNQGSHNIEERERERSLWTRPFENERPRAVRRSVCEVTTERPLLEGAPQGSQSIQVGTQKCVPSLYLEVCTCTQKSVPRSHYREAL